MKILKIFRINAIWVQIALAFLGTYGMSYLGGLMGISNVSFSVSNILLMSVVYILLSQTKQNLIKISEPKQRRRRCLYAEIVSFLFCVTMIMGYQLQVNGLTECGVKGKGLILLRAACLSAAIFPLVNLLFQGIEKLTRHPLSDNAKSEEQNIIPQHQKRMPWKPMAVFAVSTLVIFVCLIPVWLAYYPMIMSYDFHRQVNEAAKGFAWFWPYQPIAHTWVIWLFLQLGQAWGNLEAGMAGMTLLQMFLYSLVTAYACTFLYRVVKKKWPVVGAVAFFGIFPLNSVMVICSTKDVLFSIFFLLFALLIAERFFFQQSQNKILRDILILVTGCLMMQFRNNAIYAITVFGILWVLFAARKEKLHIFFLCVLLIVGGKGGSIAIKTAIGTTLEAPKVEMYSVPIQQFARVGCYHGQELDEEMWTLLNSCIRSEVWGDYNPPIADTVKSSGVEFDVSGQGHMKQFLQKWFRIGSRYPNEFIDAFLELTRGYWFWDDKSYAECLGYGTEGRMGVIYTYNSSEIEGYGEIAHVSKFPWLEEQLEKIVSANVFFQWPIISIVFKGAFYFWSLWLLFICFLYLRQKKQAIFCLLPLAYMATMLLGPVVQMRYLFPIMVTLPVLASLLVMPKEDNVS